MVISVVYCSMLKMKLDRKEIEFVSEAMLTYDAIDGITVNDIEVRVQGRYLNKEGEETAVGSSAIYRTTDARVMYGYHLNKAKEAQKELQKVLDKRP